MSWARPAVVIKRNGRLSFSGPEQAEGRWVIAIDDMVTGLVFPFIDFIGRWLSWSSWWFGHFCGFSHNGKRRGKAQESEDVSSASHAGTLASKGETFIGVP